MPGSENGKNRKIKGEGKGTGSFYPLGVISAGGEGAYNNVGEG